MLVVHVAKIKAKLGGTCGGDINVQIKSTQQIISCSSSKFILMTQRGIHKNDKFDSFSFPAVQSHPDTETLTKLITSSAKWQIKNHRIGPFLNKIDLSYYGKPQSLWKIFSWFSINLSENCILKGQLKLNSLKMGKCDLILLLPQFF